MQTLRSAQSLKSADLKDNIRRGGRKHPAIPRASGIAPKRNVRKDDPTLAADSNRCNNFNCTDNAEALVCAQGVRRSQAYMAEAQRLSHTGMFGWNPSTGEQFWSDETFRIFEFDSSSKLSWQRILECVHPQDVHSVKTAVAAADTGERIDLEFRLLMPDGRIKYLHVAGKAESYETDRIEVVGAVIDVTAHKLTEMELRRSQARLADADQLRLRQLAAQYSLRREERVGERRRIARELHDTLLQSFQALLFHLQVAFDLLPDRPQESKQKLGSVIGQAVEAIREARDVVQGLRSSVRMNNDLVPALNTLGQELAAGQDTTNAPAYHIELEGAPRDLHPVVCDEVYRIAGESLRNAFRHAGAQLIEMEIRYDEEQLRLGVRDDGRGIKPEALSGDGHDGHFGISGMRERAKLLGGKLSVWSNQDSGTQVELTIPAARAYTPFPVWTGLAETFFEER